MNGKRETSQTGRSMLEMMGYMGAVIVIVAGISKIVNNVFAEFRMSEASIQLTELSTAIVQTAAIDTDYQKVINMLNDSDGTECKKADSEFSCGDRLKIIPNSFRVKGGNIYHVFGGKVTLAVPHDEYDASKTGNKFSITFDGLSREQCIELAMKDWQSNKIADLYAIFVNNDDKWYWPVYTEIQVGDKIHSLPILRSAVAGTDDDNGECKSGNGNSIMWIFN